MELVYYYYLFVFLIFCYFLDELNFNITKFLLIVVSSVLIIFQLIKNPIVDDGGTYLKIFDSVNNYLDFLDQGKEPAFSIIPALLKSINIYNQYSIFLVFALIGIAFKVKLFYKYSTVPLLTILIYFSYFYLQLDLSGIRSGCAIAIFMWAVQDIEKKRLVLFFSKLLLASFFHSSILISLPFYFINPVKWNIKWYIVIYILLILLNVMHLNPIQNFLGNLSQFDRLANYTSGSEANGQDFIPFANIYIIYLVEIYFLHKYSKQILSFDKRAVIISKIFYFGIVILFIFGPVSYTMASRLSEIFIMFNCILLTYFIILLKKIELRISYKIFLLIYTSYNLYISLNVIGLEQRHYFG